MTKNEFEAYLRKKGFITEIEKGCVKIVTNNMNDIDLIEKMAHEAGYVGYYGWKDIKNYGNV